MAPKNGSVIEKIFLLTSQDFRLRSIMRNKQLPYPAALISLGNTKPEIRRDGELSFFSLSLSSQDPQSLPNFSHSW